MVDAGEVVTDHADVIVGHVRELRAARLVADGPHAGGRRPAPIVDLDEAVLVPLDPGGLEFDAVGVRDPSACDEDVRALDPASAPSRFTCNLRSRRTAPRPARRGAGTDIDPLVLEELTQGLRDVAVLAVGQGVVPLDDRHAAAEAAKGLGQLEPDVAAPQDDEVTGTRSRSRASTCVIGRASARPGIGSIRAREPVLITTTSPRRVHVPPSAATTSIVLGPTKRPCPMTNSAPLSR